MLLLKKITKIKSFPKNSLRLRLIFILSFTALFIWAIATAIAWFEARKEVNQMFDAQQVLFAQRLASSNLRDILIERKIRGGFNSHLQRKPHYDDDALAFAIFSPNGELLLGDHAKGDHFVFSPAQGFTQAKLADGDDDLWRIFWLPSEDQRLLVAVGQELDYREDLINDMVFGQMWVWIAGLPLLIGLMILLINRELSILNRLGKQIQQRSPDNQTPLITEKVPTEVLPLVNELNAFLARTSDLLLRERRFTSDAAHELRSPLAGLRIQAEIAQLASDDNVLREQALSNLIQGIDRSTQVIEQLLTLSRLDDLQKLENVERIDWQQLIYSVINELYIQAQKKQIELIFEAQSIPETQYGQPLLLSLMLRNIIDNALKYCPEGSCIWVKLSTNQLFIEDNGGGVESSDLAKLSQRFYRPAGQNEKGSGLGLSIVKRIAELHQFKLAFENLQEQQQRIGLRVKLSF